MELSQSLCDQQMIRIPRSAENDFLWLDLELIVIDRGEEFPLLIDSLQFIIYKMPVQTPGSSSTDPRL